MKRRVQALLALFLVSICFVVFSNTSIRANNYVSIDSWETLKTIFYTDSPAGNYLDNQYILTSDIDANNEIAYPIGDAVKSFEGVFNGDGHVIRNLNIIKNETSSQYTGLFAVNKGIIKNLGIALSQINGNSYVGGICGANYGRIENCYNEATITGTAGFIGGLCGINYGKIQLSFNIGTITGLSYVGGITGDNNLKVHDVYSLGLVSGTNGNSIGMIIGNNNNSIGAEVINAYSITGLYDAIGSGKTIVDDNTVSNVKLLSREELAIQNTYIDFKSSDDAKFLIDDTQNNYVFPKLYIRKDNTNQVFIEVLQKEEDTTNYASGNGTCYNPYVIETEVHLNNVRNNLTSWFVLNNNISLLNDFTPIGTEKNRFKGVFEGNAKRLMNVTVNPVPNETATGIFGFNAGTIVGLSADVSVSAEGIEYVGGLVGFNTGTIAQCYTISTEPNAIIEGKSAGGIAGYNSGKISNVYSTSNVHGQISGGIVGTNQTSEESRFDPVVQYAYSLGTVTGTTCGQIAGMASVATLKNVVWDSKSSVKKVAGIGISNDPEDPNGSTAYYVYDLWTTPLVAINFSSTVWGMGVTNINGGYPYLKNNPTIPVEKVEIESTNDKKIQIGEDGLKHISVDVLDVITLKALITPDYADYKAVEWRLDENTKNYIIPLTSTGQDATFKVTEFCDTSLRIVLVSLDERNSLAGGEKKYVMDEIYIDISKNISHIELSPSTKMEIQTESTGAIGVKITPTNGTKEQLNYTFSIYENISQVAGSTQTFEYNAIKNSDYLITYTHNNEFILSYNIETAELITGQKACNVEMTVGANEARTSIKIDIVASKNYDVSKIEILSNGEVVETINNVSNNATIICNTRIEHDIETLYIKVYGVKNTGSYYAYRGNPSGQMKVPFGEQFGIDVIKGQNTITIKPFAQNGDSGNITLKIKRNYDTDSSASLEVDLETPQVEVDKPALEVISGTTYTVTTEINNNLKFTVTKNSDSSRVGIITKSTDGNNGDNIKLDLEKVNVGEKYLSFEGNVLNFIYSTGTNASSCIIKFKIYSESAVEEATSLVTEYTIIVNIKKPENANITKLQILYDDQEYDVVNTETGDAIIKYQTVIPYEFETVSFKITFRGGRTVSIINFNNVEYTDLEYDTFNAITISDINLNTGANVIPFTTKYADSTSGTQVDIYNNIIIQIERAKNSEATIEAGTIIVDKEVTNFIVGNIIPQDKEKLPSASYNINEISYEFSGVSFGASIYYSLGFENTDYLVASYDLNEGLFKGIIDISSFEVGKNIINFMIISENGANSKIFSVTYTKLENDNTDISRVTLSYVDLDNITNHIILKQSNFSEVNEVLIASADSLPYYVSSYTITITLAFNGAKYKVGNDTNYYTNSDNFSRVISFENKNPGDELDTEKFEVTSSFGSIKEYEINLTLGKSAVNDLESLTINDYRYDGPFIETIDSTKIDTGIVLDFENGLNSIKITAVVSGYMSTVKYLIYDKGHKEIICQYDDATQLLTFANLASGTYELIVRTISQSENALDHMVTLKIEKSKDATLKEVKLNEEVLATTNIYTSYVGKIAFSADEANFIYILPTSLTSKLYYNSTLLKMENGYYVIEAIINNLDDVTKTFVYNFKIVSEYGDEYQEDYSITISRDKNNESNLVNDVSYSYLKGETETSISYTKNDNTNNYTGDADLDNTINEITSVFSIPKYASVKISLGDVTHSITNDKNKVLEINQLISIPAKSGQFVIEIAITAQNGTDSTKYYYTFTKAKSTNDYIDNIFINDVALNDKQNDPDFYHHDEREFVYETEETRISINIVTENKEAICVLDGQNQTNSIVIVLSKAKYELYIQITSEENVAEGNNKYRQYTLIIQADGADQTPTVVLKKLEAYTDTQTKENKITNFLENRTAYSITGIPYNQQNLYISFTTEDGASIKANGETLILNQNNGTYVFKTSIGVSTLEFELTDESGNFVAFYTITCDRNDSENRLDSLSSTNGELNYAFSSYLLNYVLYVIDQETPISLQFIVHNLDKSEFEVFGVNGETETSLEPTPIEDEETVGKGFTTSDFNLGEYTAIKIILTPKDEDGSDRTYIIDILKQKSKEAEITSLTINGLLIDNLDVPSVKVDSSETFLKDSFKVTVEFSLGATCVAELDDGTKVNLVSGEEASLKFSDDFAQQVIILRIKSEDESTSDALPIIYTREADTNNDLMSVSVNDKKYEYGNETSITVEIPYTTDPLVFVANLFEYDIDESKMITAKASMSLVLTDETLTGESITFTEYGQLLTYTITIVVTAQSGDEATYLFNFLVQTNNEDDFRLCLKGTVTDLDRYTHRDGTNYLRMYATYGEFYYPANTMREAFVNSSENICIYDKNDKLVTSDDETVGNFYKIKLVINMQVYDELNVVCIGDTDNDGMLSANDYYLIKNQSVTEGENLSAIQLMIYDYTKDGRVNMNDFIVLARDL